MAAFAGADRRQLYIMQRTEVEILVRTRQAEVYRYLRYLAADSAAAEDLAQETSNRQLQGARPILKPLDAGR